MPPEEKELLEKSVLLAEDNNKILLSIKRGMQWSRILTVIYWLLIIGISIGAFYFVQPYVDQIVKTYGSFSNAIKNFQK
jgi:hypothetical protein